MAISLRDSINIKEFVNLSKSEKLLPSFMTSVKSVKISKVDKLIVDENDSLSDIDLLKGVKLIENGYVCLVGLVVSGEWTVPDNCGGGVSICLVDKRMKLSREAALGSYNTPAAKKSFSFKVIPNYSITTADAKRSPWQLLVNIRGVKMEAGWYPLSLEYVAVCIVYENIIKLGLRAKITDVTDQGSIELTEAVVDEFLESVPMADRLDRYKRSASFGGKPVNRNKPVPNRSKSFNNNIKTKGDNNLSKSGGSLKKVNKPEPVVEVTEPIVTEVESDDVDVNLIDDDEHYDASWLSF